MVDLAILDFRGPIMGSLKSQCTTSYRSSIETIALTCLVFEKIAFCSLASRSKMADLSHLRFYGSNNWFFQMTFAIMGSLKSPFTTSCRSSINTIALSCLVFEKISFFCILATDRQTDERMDSTDALSRSRCCEQRLNK